MGNPQTTWWQEAWQGISKVLIWIFYISAGTILKLTFDSRAHKLTFLQMLTKTALSIIVGSLFSIWCVKTHHTDLGIILVPTATVAGEGIVGYIILKFPYVADRFFKFVLPNDKK